VDDTGASTVLILGGRSEIGIELAVRLAPGALFGEAKSDRLSLMEI
jgi:hypothetical protein